MAYQTSGKKKSLASANRGIASAGSENKTPPPVHGHGGFNRGNYGSNADETPSSIAPGKSVTSTLGANLRASGDAGALDVVQSKGVSLRDNILNSQTRSVADRPYPTAFGHKNPNAKNPKIPGAST